MSLPAAPLQWHPTNAPIASVRTDDLCFVTPDLGWAVNSNGQIIRTDDGGDNWTTQFQTSQSTPEYLRAVTFASADVGWVGSMMPLQTLYHTTDGGKNWLQVTNLPASAPKRFCGLFAVNEQVVYGAGTSLPLDGPPRMLKTTNGGKSWTTWDMGHYAATLIDVYFTSPDRGWVVGGRAAVPPVLPLVGSGFPTKYDFAPPQAGRPLHHGRGCPLGRPARRDLRYAAAGRVGLEDPVRRRSARLHLARGLRLRRDPQDDRRGTDLAADLRRRVDQRPALTRERRDPGRRLPRRSTRMGRRGGDPGHHGGLQQRDDRRRQDLVECRPDRFVPEPIPVLRPSRHPGVLGRQDRLQVLLGAREAHARGPAAALPAAPRASGGRPPRPDRVRRPGPPRSGSRSMSSIVSACTSPGPSTRACTLRPRASSTGTPSIARAIPCRRGTTFTGWSSTASPRAVASSSALERDARDVLGLARWLVAPSRGRSCRVSPCEAG